jgi:hypothetical protein
MRNCIVWGNAARSGPQIHESPLPARCCIQDWTAGGEGNIADDPRLLDPDGPDDDAQTYEDNDYHPAPDSPCVDAGENEDWMWEGADLDGNPRIYPGAHSWRVDIGAYEYIPTVYRFTDLIIALGYKVQLMWTSEPRQNYTVWSCIDMLNSPWHKEDTIPSAGQTTTWSDPDTAFLPRKFWRIEMQSRANHWEYNTD